MDVELEKLIDEIWNLSLARISKKELSPLRRSLGDDINLYVPQTGSLLVIEANSTVASFMYSSSYVSANRNAYAIMRKLGMPADYFWKFEYWLNQRAFDTLRRVINKVFSTMMSQNKEGGLDVADVDVEHMRFTLTFKDCVECAGIAAEKGICYYHAATLSGVIAALIGRDMDGFEMKCLAKGDDACVFLIGKRGDPEISSKVSDYLTPAKVAANIYDRLNSHIRGDPVRSTGNLVNVEYYQLVVANCGASNPMLFASLSFDAGEEYGTKVAPVITNYYQDNQISVIRKYYHLLRQLDVQAIEIGADIDIVLSEHPLVVIALKRKELLGFLFGEIQGLISKLLNKRMVYKESWVEGNSLRVRLSPLV